jgi:hypothetical protein
MYSTQFVCLLQEVDDISYFWLSSLRCTYIVLIVQLTDSHEVVIIKDVSDIVIRV